MVISLLASFPNAHHSVDRVTCNRRGQGMIEWDVAVRWRLRWTDCMKAAACFGAPSMKPVDILGINHYRIAEIRFREEWVTFDGWMY